MEQTVVLTSDVRLQLAKMKRNKAARVDKIVIEMLTTLIDLGIDKFFF